MRWIQTHSPADHREYFEGIIDGKLNPAAGSPLQWTWVVSDLRTKFELREALLQKADIVEQDAVLRASELWTRIAQRLHPHLRLVSPELAQVMIDSWLHDFGFELAGRPGATQIVFETVGGLLPLLVHDHGREIANEWFSRNSSSESQWRTWYEVSSKIWDRFVSEGIVTRSWVVGLLVSETIPLEVWPKNLVFDVGANLSAAEAELIVEMQRLRQVEVLIPQLDSNSTLRAYEKFGVSGRVERLDLARRDFRSEHSAGGRPLSGILYTRWASALAEIKGAVAEVRKMSVDFAFHEIAIVAPDIEAYWLILAEHLAKEKIPVERSVSVNYNHFAEINLWLANLRLRFGSIDSSDLRTGYRYLRRRQKLKLNEEQFRYLFSRVFDREDLNRSPELANALADQVWVDEPMRRDRFLAEAVAQFPADEPQERAIHLLRSIINDCPPAFRLSPKSWIAYLERAAARTSENLSREGFGVRGGVVVANLSELDGARVKGVVVLGLDGPAFQGATDGVINHADLAGLESQYGLVFPTLHRPRALLFDLEWLCKSRDRSRIVLSYAETDLLGQPRAPSVAWLRGGLDTKSSDPEPTLFDRSLQDSVRPDPPSPRPYSGNQLRPARLSVSLIDQYKESPFKALMESVFRLREPGSIDLDVDQRKGGSLAHEVMAVLLRQNRLDWAEEEIAKTVEETQALREKENSAEIVMANNPVLWRGYVRRLSLQIKRNLDAEVSYQTFQETKIEGIELDFEAVFRPLSATWHCVNESQEGDIRFTGRIDRVDRLKDGRLLVIDYKSSRYRLVSENANTRSKSLQMTLYIEALKNGWTRLGRSPVAGAVYQILRDGSRKPARVWGEGPWLQFGFSKSMPEQEFDEYQAKSMSLATELAGLICSGHFAPNPADEKDCETCNWRLSCHAAHLNQ